MATSTTPTTTSATTVAVKLVTPDGTIRRVVVARGVGVAELKQTARGVLPVPGETELADVVVAYKDEEGDDIAVVTDAEVGDFLNACAAANKAPKFFVRVRGEPAAPSSSQTQGVVDVDADGDADAVADAEANAADAKEKEEDALTQLARALSNASTVHAVQAHVASSPVVNEAVVGVSRAFLDGGAARAVSVAAESLPALRSVVADAAQADPALASAVDKLMRDGVDVDVDVDVGAFVAPFAPMAAAWMPFLASAFAFAPPSGAPAHPQPHPQPQPQQQHPRAAAASASASATATPGVHPFVVCDGCDSSAALAATARQAGTVSPRGWIAGTRFASTSVRNFDLCESCLASGAFTASHGPFVAMEPKHHHHPHHHHHHGHGQHGQHGHGHGHHHGGGGCGPCGPHPRPGGQPGCGPRRWGNNGAFGAGWAASASPSPSPSSSQQRGCRGSGRVGVVNAVNEVIGRCAAAVAAAAQEADNDDVAQIARAISESLKTHADDQAKANAAAKSVPVVPAATTTATAQTQPTNVDGVRKVVPVASDVPVAPQATSSDEEWVVEDAKPVAAAASTSTSTSVTDPMDKWRDALQRLHAIGFTDAAEYIPFLEEENGDLERVINRIVRRNA